MANEFNANDIFEIAVKIEQNGAIFYRDAAKLLENEDHKQFLLELAKMEDDHEKTFAAMQKQLTDKEAFSSTFDPGDENVLYLKALADTRVFFEKDKPESNFQGILGAAIQAEKDSIAFYLGMKELVPLKLGQSKINDIIKEEMSHIRILAGKLMEY
ncbi:MAG: ferritin family protein [Desulfobacula sp.]|jgi:rubrerythrin|uniref:ferritin-like domain-containing protein n=1 Tax=Desulfobacula sp. TaxID=2593537 RepID=UPI001DA5F7F9|nr:ferritin family protein [Desulfobacula sp.]MBT3484733.1 ferritin family protein [Desulfobacula sp.]MBT3804363.1 ferritin family protein [Desulfobacula sp.]MBT4025154.1 ferritin family protein [Desulfobacula sp.]MBT4198556.1 ferritin family protein [Desulfobacula sp.]